MRDSPALEQLHFKPNSTHKKNPYCRLPILMTSSNPWKHSSHTRPPTLAAFEGNTYCAVCENVLYCNSLTVHSNVPKEELLFVVQAAFPQIHSASSIGSGSAFDFVCGILIPTFSVCFYFVGDLDEVSEELEKSRHKLATLCTQKEGSRWVSHPCCHPRIEGWPWESRNGC
jgi:hypothetical protein